MVGTGTRVEGASLSTADPWHRRVCFVVFLRTNGLLAEGKALPTRLMLYIQ